MLSWVKRRVRMFENYDWAMEEDDRPNRRTYVAAAIEDWQWMTSGAMATAS